MKILLYGLGGIVALLALALLFFYVAGARMPRAHRSVITTKLAAPRAVVWRAITDYAAMPQWWPAVKSVRLEKLPDGTELAWNLDAHGHEIPFRTTESRENEKLVRAIAKDDLPFGGTWTFVLTDAPGGGTQLELTEDGTITPPVFRAIAKWFIGLDATQRDFVKHLRTKLEPGSEGAK